MLYPFSPIYFSSGGSVFVKLLYYKRPQTTVTIHLDGRDHQPFCRSSTIKKIIKDKLFIVSYIRFQLYHKKIYTLAMSFQPKKRKCSFVNNQYIHQFSTLQMKAKVINFVTSRQILATKWLIIFLFITILLGPKLFIYIANFSFTFLLLTQLPYKEIEFTFTTEHLYW